jgi:hypothetical protein
MTITVFPVDAVAGQPEYSGRKLRQAIVSAHAVLGTTGRPLGARSGIRSGTPDSVFSVAGTTWSVGVHVGTIDGAAAGEAGAYTYAVDAPETGPIDAASASITRWDLVYAQLTDPAESAGSGAPRVEIKYLAGTAASTLPATPARSIPLLRVVVPQAGGGNPSAVAVAPFSASAGGYVQFRSKALLDAWTTAGKGTHATVTDDSDAAKNGDYVRVGSSWVAQSGAGVDSNGWTYVTLSNGKRMFTRELSAWSPGESFGPQGGTNWVQTRVNGFSPPEGMDFAAFMVSVSTYPQTTALNSLQALLIAYLSATSGSVGVSVLVANPTAAVIPNSNMNLKIAVQLIEK